MTYGNGSWYEGYWFEGKQNGKGVLVDAEGKRKEGTWNNGVLVNRI